MNSANTNLISYSQSHATEADGSFTYGVDTINTGFFGIVDRSVDPRVANDSLSSNDTFGLLGSSEPFDVIALSNGTGLDPSTLTAPATATWTFDVSSALQLTNVSIGVAAMGNFNQHCEITVAATVAGAETRTAFRFDVTERAHTYTLEDGTTRTISDPYSVDALGDGSFEAVVTNNYAT